MTPRSRRPNKTPCIIPLKPDFTETIKPRPYSVKTKTKEGVESKTEITVPVLPQTATKYETLEFVRQFNEGATILGWEAKTKFNNFTNQLQGLHKTTWATCIVAANSKTFKEFNEAVKRFLTKKFDSESDYDIQMDYLRDIRKPGDMSPSEFLNFLQINNELTKIIPGAPATGAGLTDREMQRAYLNAMPRSWQEKFEDANMYAHNTDINKMRSYFERQAQKDPYIANTNGNGNQRNGNHNNSNNGNNNRNRNNRNARGRNSNNNGGRGQRGHDNNNQARLTDDSPCPLPNHRNHTWGECRARRSSQGTNNSNNSTRSNRSNSSNNNRNNNRDSNVAEANESNNSNDRESHYFEFEETTEEKEEAILETYYLNTEEPEPEYCQPCQPVQQEIFEDKTQMETAAEDFIPCTISTTKAINDTKGRYLFKCLLDSGGTDVMVEKSKLGKNVEIFTDDTNRSFTTTQGSFKPVGFVYLSDLTLPEFGHTRKVSKVKAYVFDAPQVRYGLILGRKFLRMASIQLDFANNKMKWFETEVPFHDASYLKDNDMVCNALKVNPFRVNKAEHQSFRTISNLVLWKDWCIPSSQVPH